jgi:type I restriction enzyme S subunit
MTAETSAVTDLLKREPARIVAGTGILFRALAQGHPSAAIEDVLESHRGGVWGDESVVGVGFPVLRSTNMRGTRADVKEAAWRQVPQKQAEECALRSGDILVTKSSGSSDLVGKATLFDEPDDGRTYLFSNFTHRLRPDSSRIDSRFLAWFLRSPQSLRWRFQTQQNAVGLRNLQTGAFLAQPLPLPPITIQRAVADYLDRLEAGSADPAVLPAELLRECRIVTRVEAMVSRVDEARAVRLQSAADTAALLPATSAKLFELSSGWKTLEVGDFCEPAQYGYTESATDRPVGPRFLRITDIQDGRVDWDRVPYCLCPKPDQYLLRPNDLVFARTGATTGKSFVIRECPEAAVFASYLIRLRIRDTVLVDYLYRYFQSPAYWAQIADEKKGTGQPNLNGSKLERLKIPIPPFGEQRAIVSYLDALQAKVDELKALQAETGTQLDALVPAIIDLAFSGEL